MTPRQDAALDEALADTFPASDPPLQTVPVAATGSDEDPAGRRLDLYRVIPRDEADNAFGAQPHYAGRRWSSEGRPAVYASLSVGGALLEALAHTEGRGPTDLVLATTSLPAGCIEPAHDLPKHWRDHPYRAECSDSAISGYDPNARSR